MTVSGHCCNLNTTHFQYLWLTMLTNNSHLATIGPAKIAHNVLTLLSHYTLGQVCQKIQTRFGATGFFLHALLPTMLHNHMSHKFNDILQNAGLSRISDWHAIFLSGPQTVMVSTKTFPPIKIAPPKLPILCRVGH